MLTEDERRFGASTRPDKLPAWALLLRSPFRAYSKATSWLGGVPYVPLDFKWPTGADGQPLHFIAQIDLSALQPERSTNATAPGLPHAGALLVFVGSGYAVRVLSPSDMARAVKATPPQSLGSLRNQEFFAKGYQFNHWPVDPVGYLSHGERRPNFLPDPFATPQQWITNWGLASVEAELVLSAFERELRILSQPSVDHELGKSPSSGRFALVEKRMGSKIQDHKALLKDRAPKVISALKDWLSLATQRPAQESVDVAALTHIFAERTELGKDMPMDYGTRHLLPGFAPGVWRQILADVPGEPNPRNLSAIPQAFRSFVDTIITDWRGHRLFGLEPPLYCNGEDLRYRIPLISIAADELLATMSEHHYGFSVWLEQNAISEASYVSGQFVRHSKG